MKFYVTVILDFELSVIKRKITVESAIERERDDGREEIPCRLKLIYFRV